MSPYPATARSAPDPLKKAAHLANVWGWSYVITLVAIFAASDVPAGPMRECVLDISILFTIIGIFELVWRRKLLKTREVKWIKVLALNEVGGTLALLWNLWLLESVPEPVLTAFFKSNVSPATMKMLLSVASMTGNRQLLNDTLIGHTMHRAQWMTVFIVGPILLLSQFWVIYSYLRCASDFARLPAAPVDIPPVLK